MRFSDRLPMGPNLFSKEGPIDYSNRTYKFQISKIMIRGRKKSKSFFFFLNTILLVAVIFLVWSHFLKKDFGNDFFEARNKKIFLDLDGLQIIRETEASDVAGFLREISLEITRDDTVVPAQEEKIFSGSGIYVQKARKISVLEGGKKREFMTLQKTVGEAVREKEELNMGEDDLIEPAAESLVGDKMEIEIVHVSIEEEKKAEAIAFKTVTNEDDKLGWREKKVTQKGEKGIREVIYKVIYHNGKEISRKKIGEETTKESVPEIITKGTFIKIGKAHTGLGSWYAQPQHLKNAYPSLTGYYAANPWLTKGSYVKVTNKANGKSIIARINDRGPFGPNRIIDLSKEAFAAVASLGAGIVDVKMEEITN